MGIVPDVTTSRSRTPVSDRLRIESESRGIDLQTMCHDYREIYSSEFIYVQPDTLGRVR